MHEIKNLSVLLKDFLGDRELLTYTTKNLTNPGENYGSLMLSVEIKVRNGKTGAEETVYAVAKTPPPNEFSKEMFNVQVTFKNEIEFYRTVFPVLRKMQEEHGLTPCTYFPDFLGGRFNLDGGNVVDDNAALVLDNLVLSKFTTESRYIGFSYEATRLILRDLANFHATCIAVKLKKPEVFKGKIMPYLNGFMNGPPESFIEMTANGSSEILKKNSKFSHLEDKLVKIVRTVVPYQAREPFATVTHHDLWVNNTMIKYDDGKPVENKFVDFQVCRYHSPATDLFFFLFTSVQDDVIREKLDEFIDFYHEELVGNLESFKCDTAEFSREAFEKEILAIKTEQITHVCGMLFPIFMDKSKAVELKDFSPDAVPFVASERHVEKLYLVVELLDKKGWLD